MRCQISTEGWQDSPTWVQLHMEGSWKRLEAGQDRGDNEKGEHRVKPDLGQPGNAAPNNISLQRLMCPLSKSIRAAIRHLVTGFVCHKSQRGWSSESMVWADKMLCSDKSFYHLA